MNTRYFQLLLTAIYSAMLMNACSSDTDAAQKEENAGDFPDTTNAAAIVQRLEELGYLSYADPKDHESIRLEMIDKLGRYGELSTELDTVTRESLDYRLHGLDNESLFERDGFLNKINDLQPAFRKIGLTITVSDYLDTIHTDGSYSRNLTINGRHYKVFDRFREMGWGEAAKSFAEILNEQLSMQNSKERVYLISGGNDGGMVFLTDAQFQYLDSVLTNLEWKPMRVEDWWKVSYDNNVDAR